MNWWIKKWITERIYDYMVKVDGLINEWINERMIVWVNEWINDWIILMNIW